MLTLQGWARDGLTDEQIAHNIGINPATLYKWIAKYGKIGEAIKKGKAPVDIQVENALLKRALGYEYEEVTTEVTEIPYLDKAGKIRTKIEKHVRKTKKMVVPDVTAQIFWLRNRRRGRWNNNPPEIDQTENAENDGFIEALTATAAEDWADES